MFAWFIFFLLFYSFVGASRMRQLDKDMLALSILSESLSVTAEVLALYCFSCYDLNNPFSLQVLVCLCSMWSLLEQFCIHIGMIVLWLNLKELKKKELLSNHF